MTAIREQTIIINPKSNLEIDVFSVFVLYILVTLSFFVFNKKISKKNAKKFFDFLAKNEDLTIRDSQREM